ncbi:MAG TPA: ArsR family transcriptional regulator [Dissulfuribacter thermophilus]|uniref:ArsR family transcriptional regulator n=1 Tax=Dissulfuribacter thermophilus TaxID=1156395 RepID=A0A7V2WT57_9BACT|nr:ArsR family transcriptional regulator [Dissulfuribacter thermophilus]
MAMTMERRRVKGDPKKYRDEMWLQTKILTLLEEKGPLTVNEISQELSWPNDEIMMYLMAMRRYGLVEEAPKARRDRYYKYGKKERS